MAKGIINYVVWILLGGGFVFLYYTTGKSFLGVTVKEKINKDTQKIGEIKRLIKLYYLKKGKLPTTENLEGDLGSLYEVKRDLFIKDDGSLFSIKIISASNIVVE